MENNNISFEEAEQALRYSWEVHRQAFGPILEPAFQENQSVRILVINALNHISRRDIKRGLELLKEIRPHCIYDEDMAAWTFFVGLCFEMCGAEEQMLSWYEKAAEYHHRFYLPYLKLARAFHRKSEFARASSYYERAISCLLEPPEHDRDETVLGAAYANLTACLTMLHQYPAAEAAWQSAQKYPLPPGAPAIAAMLHEAMNDREQPDNS